VRVQQATAQAEQKVPPDHRIAFRIGVHQGDVVVENDDLFGDGVNVAARLEGLSEGGGVCISGRVYEDTLGRLDLPFEDRGEQQVKNIARPVRVYGLGKEAIAALTVLPTFEDAPANTFSKFAGQLFARSPSKSVRWASGAFAAVLAMGVIVWQAAVRHNSPALPDAQSNGRGPTIAVLPFDNMSGDASQEFFSDGLTDEVITALSHFEPLRVLARNTTFAYKSKASDVQELGRQLQARYVIEGSFRRVPDQISVTAQLIDARTGTHVWAQTYERPTTSTSLLAIQDDIAQRVGAAVGDIRTGAIATAELERTHDVPAAELSSYECVIQAHRARTTVTVAEPCSGSPKRRVEADRVLAINPNDAGALAILGNDLAYAGDWDYGRQLAEKGIALAGPSAPHWWWWAIAKDYYHHGEYTKALEFFSRAYVEENWLDHLHLIFTLPYLDRIDDARAQIPILLKLKPGMTVSEADRYYKMWCFDADFRQRMNRALRLAGLPEE
jgi:adenylate cyclase